MWTRTRRETNSTVEDSILPWIWKNPKLTSHTYNEQQTEAATLLKTVKSGMILERWCYTGRFATTISEQHSVAILKQCCNHSKQCRNNVANLCCAKSCCCESSSLTSDTCNEQQTEAATLLKTVKTGMISAQHCVAILEQCCNHSKQCRNNVATLCCAKSCRCESSRVTLP